MNNAEVLIKFKASGTEDVEKKSKNVANTLKKTGQDLAIVSVAAGGAIAGIAKVGTEFEKSISNVQAISGATADDMKLLENKAREMHILLCLGDFSAFADCNFFSHISSLHSHYWYLYYMPYRHRHNL